MAAAEPSFSAPTVVAVVVGLAAAALACTHWPPSSSQPATWLATLPVLPATDASICVVQYDDRSDAELASLGIIGLPRRNAATCVGDCDYKFIRRPLFDAPPYWQKVAAVRQSLLRGCRSAIFLDTDVALQQPPSALARQFGSSDAFITADHASIRLNYGDAAHSPFIASVFGIQSTAGGLAMADSWLRQYTPGAWRRTPHASASSEERAAARWECAGGRSACQWAVGRAYEQGSFVSTILPAHAARMVRVDAVQLNSPCQSAAELSEALACHFSPKAMASVFVCDMPRPGELECTCNGEAVRMPARGAHGAAAGIDECRREMIANYLRLLDGVGDGAAG